MNYTKTMNEIVKFEEIYSPSTLLGVYANAIKTVADGKILIARGIYIRSEGKKEYSGYYYDKINSPNDESSIQAKVPNFLRSKLENNSIYIFKGFIEKKIKFSSIDLVFVVDDVIDKEQNQISDVDLKRFELIQIKNKKEFRSVESFIKECVYTNTIPKIANIYGISAIVQDDFELGIAESMINFNITNYRCSLNSKNEISSMIVNLKNNGFDIISLVRGGGDDAHFDIFNDPDLCTEIININPFFITALGHTVNDTLIDKLADKKFALPHDYGNSLRVWVEKAKEEQANSKSIFIDQVKKDLSKTFQEQINILNKQLDIKNKEFEASQKKFKELLEMSDKEKKETLLANQKTFEANIKVSETTILALKEQIKIRDENQKKINENFEKSLKQQLELVSNQAKLQQDMLSREIVAYKREKENNTIEILNLRKTKNKIFIFVFLSLIIGIIIGIIINTNY